MRAGGSDHQPAFSSPEFREHVKALSRTYYMPDSNQPQGQRAAPPEAGASATATDGRRGAGAAPALGRGLSPDAPGRVGCCVDPTVPPWLG